MISKPPSKFALMRQNRDARLERQRKEEVIAFYERKLAFEGRMREERAGIEAAITANPAFPSFGKPSPRRAWWRP